MIEHKVRAWLTAHGYPLELRVADILRKVDVPADHYREYTDPATGKHREIDLMGYLDHSVVSVHMVFECKHSKDKPWVLFCTENRPLTSEGFVASVPSTHMARYALERLTGNPAVQSMIMFKARTFVGFRLLRAHTDNQDAAYHAVLGVTSACISTAEAIGQYNHSVVYIPIIVIDSPLLECYLPEGGSELELAPASHGLLLHNVGGGNHVIIHVVHVDSLSEFISDVKRDTAALNAIAT